MVPREGFEPTRPNGHCALNAARLPFRHLGWWFSDVKSHSLRRIWWAMEDLNLRPPRCERGALTAELTAPARLKGYYSPARLIRQRAASHKRAGFAELSESGFSDSGIFRISRWFCWAFSFWVDDPGLLDSGFRRNDGTNRQTRYTGSATHQKRRRTNRRRSSL